MTTKIVAIPTVEDVRKARQQATETVTEVIEQARTPLYAALGAGETVVGYARRARNEAAELRGRVERTELRELADSYRGTLAELYQRLTVRGERVYGQLRDKPQVGKAFSRVERLTDDGQAQVEKLVTDARALTDEVLGRVGRRSEPAGDIEPEVVERPAKKATATATADKPADKPAAKRTTRRS